MPGGTNAMIWGLMGSTGLIVLGEEGSCRRYPS